MTLTLTPRAVSSSIAGIPAAVAGTLIITLGRASRPQSSTRLLDRGRGVVGEVGRAFEGDEAVAPAARLVDRTQQVGGAADVVEREREEELLRVAHAGGDGGAELVVVAVGAGDRLGEDRRVRGRAGDRAVGDQLGERRRSSSSSRESVSSQIETPASCSCWRRFMPRSLHRRDEVLERDVGIGEAPVIDRDALADEPLDRVGDVPDVDVHAGHDAIVGEPEGDELAARGIAAEDDAVPGRAKPAYSMPTSYWSEKKYGTRS